MSLPAPGAKINRMAANAETTIVVAATPTLKLRAKLGSTGATSPYPSAIIKDAAMSTFNPVGIRVFAGVSGGVLSASSAFVSWMRLPLSSSIVADAMASAPGLTIGIAPVAALM